MSDFLPVSRPMILNINLFIFLEPSWTTDRVSNMNLNEYQIPKIQCQQAVVLVISHIIVTVAGMEKLINQSREAEDQQLIYIRIYLNY